MRGPSRTKKTRRPPEPRRVPTVDESLERLCAAFAALGIEERNGMVGLGTEAKPPHATLSIELPSTSRVKRTETACEGETAEHCLARLADYVHAQVPRVRDGGSLDEVFRADLVDPGYASVATGQTCVVELPSGCVYGQCEAGDVHHATVRIAGVAGRYHRSMVQHPVTSWAHRCDPRGAGAR